MFLKWKISLSLSFISATNTIIAYYLERRFDPLDLKDNPPPCYAPLTEILAQPVVVVLVSHQEADGRMEIEQRYI